MGAIEGLLKHLTLAFILMASATFGIAHAEPRNIQVCAACHGEDGAGVGFDYVPIIAGTPAAHLEEALFAYKDGARRCVGVPVMCDAVAPLSVAFALFVYLLEILVAFLQAYIFTMLTAQFIGMSVHPAH